MSDNPDHPAKPSGRASVSASREPHERTDTTSRFASVWTAQVITLLPEAFPGVLGHSLTGRALADGLWRLATTDLRAYGEGRHRNVDDTPAGGGAGMVLRADVMGRAIEAATEGAPSGRPLICLSPRGAPLTQAMAAALAEGPGVTLICGRFEGLDERVIEHYRITEVSIGDFILTGGEIAAQALIDACVRLLPGVLGNAASTEEESFSSGLLEYPQYTRPAEWMGRAIPPVLLSGDHAGIARWRHEMAEAQTRARRPDLWRAWRERHGGDEQ